MKPIIKKKFGSSNEGYSDVNLKFIFTLLLSSVLVITTIIIFLNSYFTKEKDELVYELVLKPESKELRELNAEEYNILHSYKRLDANGNKYRIPIDRAMQLLVKEDFNKNLGKNK